MDTTSAKRKRQILPLGDPPPQTIFPTTQQSNEQRTALRVNRACNTCRRQKMRCDGPDTGSACSRCQSSGVECVFEKIPANKPPTIPAASRLSSLEEKVEHLQTTQLQIQQSIQEILIELRNCTSAFKEHLGLEKSEFPNKSTFPPMYNCHGCSDEFSIGRRYEIQETIESEDISDIPNRPSNMSIKSLLSITTPPSPRSTPYMEMSKSPKDLDSATPSTYILGSPELHIPYMKSTQSFLNEQSNSSLASTSKLERNVKNDDRTELLNQPNPNVKPFDARSAIREDKSHGWNPQDQTKNFHVLDASYPDPIERGLVTIHEAQRLFDLYETISSLFEARDGGSPPTTLQDALWEEAMARAKVSMFQRVTELEVIQTAWSESTGGTCWIVTGHAIRCAVEMGIHKALTKLSSTSESYDHEKTQILVSSARVWCALFAFGNSS
ncbi:hypothetical protein Clacol_000693 [Clathrus columnatus]|uniref:Zn(2)-C6 fungal-type domain-containing protein n=1 Tax=Clathrus columnatus TaxID=1419009 RepID=A0AAV5A1N5_9AGAM|nr:hypothetical protein Clacol_000693 [Clathrus columnatus]